MSNLSCTECGTALPRNPRRKGTRCKSCASRARVQSEAHRAAASRAMTRRWADPEQAAALARAISSGITDEEKERRRQRGKICCNCRAAAAGSEARQRAGRSLSQTRLGWCPPEYREEYFWLRRNYKMRAPEARAIIEGQMARDVERYLQTGQLQRTGRGGEAR